MSAWGVVSGEKGGGTGGSRDVAMLTHLQWQVVLQRVGACDGVREARPGDGHAAPVLCRVLHRHCMLREARQTHTCTDPQFINCSFDERYNSMTPMQEEPLITQCTLVSAFITACFFQCFFQEHNIGITPF